MHTANLGKTKAEPKSPLTNGGNYRHTDGRLATAGQWPSTNWSIVFVDGVRWPFTTDEEFRRDFTAVEAHA